MTMSFKHDNSGQVLAYCDTGLTSGSDCTGATPVNPVYVYSYNEIGRLGSELHFTLKA